jgi:4-amino-4-deoxy-L-arabinose transferase-like glycosyltransferase
MRDLKPHKSTSLYSFCWKYALIIFVIGLAFRGLYLFEASRRPDFDLVYMDEEYNLEWARSLATGIWNPPYDQLRRAPYFRAPLYPYFLAGILASSGGNTFVVRIVQIIMGSVSCVLVYWLGTKCFGQRVGLVAGFLCSIYWVLAYFDTQFLLPVLLVLLILLGMLLAFSAAERGNIWLAGLSGLSMGLYSITRPNMLLFFPFLIWWAVGTWKRSQPGLSRWFIILTILGLALPPVIITLRNRVVADDWVLIASQGGVNFYIGNNHESNGMQAVVPGTRQTWWGGYEDTRAIAEEAAGRPLKASEVSDYWFSRAFEYIRYDTADWVSLTLRKALAFIGDAEIPNNEPYEAYRHESVSLRIIPLSFGVLFGLFLVSLPGMIRTRRALCRADYRLGRVRADFMTLMLNLVLVYSVTVIAFFVTGRYRVPLLPFFAMGAAVTLVSILDNLRRRSFTSAVLMIIACAGLVTVISVDHLSIREATAGFAELTMAQNRLETGDLDGAIAGLEKIRAGGSVRAPEVYKTLARAYLVRDLYDDRNSAFEVAEEGLRSYPDDSELLWYSAVGHVTEQNWDQARNRIERFLSREPRNIRALYMGFVIARSTGKREEAESYLRKAEDVDSRHPLVEEMRRDLR